MPWLEPIVWAAQSVWTVHSNESSHGCFGIDWSLVYVARQGEFGHAALILHGRGELSLIPIHTALVHWCPDRFPATELVAVATK